MYLTFFKLKHELYMEDSL
ncbi:hypothetical protein Gogos_008317 [Gossypium gossypioides]|uniref:Uncharacterized protein n=1 Tax=Gossypium gossypioides TaxID=34282 RepID=A0A7J9CBT8_GOSGO|nr:hypothetical protein [Gossypium gossypioides]